MLTQHGQILVFLLIYLLTHLLITLVYLVGLKFFKLFTKPRFEWILFMNLIEWILFIIISTLFEKIQPGLKNALRFF